MNITPNNHTDPVCETITHDGGLHWALQAAERLWWSLTYLKPPTMRKEKTAK